jgi:hypothetical protein
MEMDEEKDETSDRASWTKPVAAEVKMDAEIGSYQSDDEPERRRLTGTIK